MRVTLSMGSCVMNRVMMLLGIFGTPLFLTASPVPASEPTAEDYIEFMKPLVGSWKSTDEQGGKTTRGTWTYRLAPNKKCFLMHSEDESGPSVQTVDGYDPVTKKPPQNRTEGRFGTWWPSRRPRGPWGGMPPRRDVGTGRCRQAAIRQRPRRRDVGTGRCGRASLPRAVAAWPRSGRG
jgi:hypothetical protein